jgi:aryl-alcohol dehydrogenase-like predicted oxidoreductase
MEKIRLGKTDLWVTKTSFGALPVQRIGHAESKKLLRRAFDAGINYFDTANAYTDSEEKLGEALHDVRQHIIISTKSGGKDKATVQEHIDESLRRLQTDYIDLFQFHNPAELPDINDPDGPFAAALEARKAGKIRHIGITNHRLKVAQAAIDSGNFETLQFPFCYLASEKDVSLVRQCAEKDMGFIAMKGLSGGMLNNAEACYAFMQQYPNVVPIWGTACRKSPAEMLGFFM